MKNGNTKEVYYDGVNGTNILPKDKESNKNYE